MIKKIFLLAFALIGTLFAYSYPRNTNMHYFAVSMSGGYSQFFTNKQDVLTQGRPAATIGFNYEYRTKSMWLQTGLESQLLMNASSLTMGNPNYVFSVLDTQGKPLNMLYTISNFRETEQLVFMNIPIMVGYYHANGFYVGAGLKFGWSLYANTDAHLDYKTVGTYDQYIDDFLSMPNHFYTDYSLDRRAQTMARFKSALAFEIGGDLLAHSYGVQPNSCRVLKLAAFAEMGLNSPYPKSGAEDVYVRPNASQAQLLEPECLYNVKTNSSYSFIPFCAGIKLTMMFRVSTPRSRCNCH